MTDPHSIDSRVDVAGIERYADQVVRRLAGGPAERRRVRAELVAHLSDAAEVGELDAALRRLGDPGAAARAFAADRAVEPAPAGRRFAAAAVDNLPLIAVTVAVFLASVVRAAGGGGWAAATFPPLLSAEVGGVCVALSPTVCETGRSAGAALWIGLALLWSVLGLAIVESLTGTTPGKRLLGLRVGTDEGLRVPLGRAVVRRTSFLVGPFAWLDWAPFLWGDRRRVLEHPTRTRVVRG